MKKLSIYITSTVIITVSAIAFLFLFFQKGANTNTNQVASIEKDVYLLTSTQIIKTRLENGLLKTLASKEHGISEVKKIVRAGSNFYVSDLNKIYKYDSNLNKLAELSLAGEKDEIYDFTSDERNIYILTRYSAEKRRKFWSPGISVYPGSLKIYDNSLINSNPISVVDFKKPGHAITKNGNYLYILDNVTSPMYVFLIDISDIHNPKFYSSKELSGINSSLHAQEIINNKWYVLGGYGTMSGSGEFIYIFDTTPEINQIKMINTQSSSRLPLGLGKEFISTANFVVRDSLLIGQGEDYGAKDEENSFIYTLNLDEGENPDFIDKKKISGTSIHYNLLDLDGNKNTFISAHDDVVNLVYVDGAGKISIAPIESSQKIIGITK